MVKDTLNSKKSMKTNLVLFTAVAAISVASIQSGTAAVIADYSLDTVPTSSSDTDTDSTAGLLFNFKSSNNTISGNYLSIRADNFRETDPDPEVASDLTVSGDRTFVATITASAGMEIALESVTWRAGAYSSNQYGSRNHSVIYVATDFTFTNIIATSGINTVNHNTSSAGTTWDNFTFTDNLGGATYDELFIGMGVTTYNDTSNGTKSLTFENLVVNGTVVSVPEPSSVALLGLGALGLVVRRRR